MSLSASVRALDDFRWKGLQGRATASFSNETWIEISLGSPGAGPSGRAEHREDLSVRVSERGVAVRLVQGAASEVQVRCLSFGESHTADGFPQIPGQGDHDGQGDYPGLEGGDGNLGPKLRRALRRCARRTYQGGHHGGLPGACCISPTPLMFLLTESGSTKWLSLL